MKQHRLILIAFALLVTAHASAQEKTSTLGEPVFPKLEYVNLNTEFGFQTDVMRGFGARVDDARRDADASAVAALAVQLAFAEKLSGKNASTVNSLQLLSEAARIAEEQQSMEAVQAVKLASSMIPSSATLIARLEDSVQMFADQRGDGDFLGFVRVENACDRVLDIYVDGQYAGFQYDGESQVYSTGNGTTHVRVMDAFGNTVSEVLFVKPDETVSWTIKP